MTKAKMKNIADEITSIGKKLSTLSVDNLIENQQRESIASAGFFGV